MSNQSYDENDEPHCFYCGNKLDAIRNHFHGRIANICKYSDCGRNWQCFKARIKKYKDSEIPEMREFALDAEDKVFNKGEPAIEWNKEIILVRQKFR